ncbi:uncharacterized protein LOC144902783 [Branchiostoma floridae x Branchiostoma belcheri]
MIASAADIGSTVTVLFVTYGGKVGVNRPGLIDCTTFNTAVTDYQAAIQNHFWVTTIPAQNQNFVIDQVMVDGSSVDLTTGGYTRVEVTVTMFGETYTFNLDNGYSPFDPGASGQEIAHKAIDHYKASHPPPSAKVYTFGHN